MIALPAVIACCTPDGVRASGSDRVVGSVQWPPGENSGLRQLQFGPSGGPSGSDVERKISSQVAVRRIRARSLKLM